MGRKLFAPTAFAAALAASLVSASAVAASGPTWDDILKDADTPADVLSYGLGLKAQRYSPATQINTNNVDALTPAWSFSFGDEKQRGQEAQALVYDGMIYVTASYSRFFALDARTGRKVWEYQARLPDDIRPCCDVVNRGPAIYQDKVFFGTLDGSVVALDRLTGKLAWKEKFGDQKVGYTMTGAPFIVKDSKTGKVLLVHGSSGDEFGVVGWLFARDPDTGKEVWARPMVEGHTGRLNGKDGSVTGNPKAPSWPRGKDGKLVEAWSHGGGAPWQTPSFDVENNTIVVGTGNPAPWNTWQRTAEGGDPLDWDSLFTSGQAYLDPTSGDLKGFFQHTPNDAWDFSGNNSVLLFDYKDPKTGKTIKASAHADRNGFFFVTDRTKLATGSGYPNKPTSLIGAYPFVQGITWAKGFDLKTGKPIETGNRPPKPKAGEEKGDTVFVSPPFLGGTNWMPMSYSPDTNLFYIPANEWGMDYWTEHLQYKAGAAYLGQGFRIKRIFDDHVGVLRAIDPVTGKIAWEHKEEMPLWAGTLTTKGGLVITGTSDGYVKAFDNKTGKELWKFQTGSGVVSCPITWEMDGEQYIGIASGYGGAVPLWGGDMADMTKKVSQGGSFWVFKLPKTKVAAK
ncbi:MULTISPECIES: methanol/ethanol family PQQ-dependent dehydrogenase [Hydrocarboniphaga]|jgi:PQQ-dependent dehydrogenase (methanol/ethanol family)|uniref:Quinoprotein alcohol dehydrogenase n=1 Tax=Hydrocarboniphaga effusa AP103 TaxID=1172194 RepID=I8TBH6_9GAMM|nr:MULTISPECIES: methanol/ethanol family PQQ-dependent dehydrogenase [Hydrocarboniphaga]EIT71190.1 quinoprotein alcohol dehydrogenase [Hydrocarboniphaga effusa AP103]MDZ4079453.1 methanol/ethanol family PQQ-dependent dehydrogenase [Hydrocarboniphaga sp.]